MLRPSRCGADHLREYREEAEGDVDVLLELAQDRGELGGVDVVGVQVVLNLEGELGDAERGAHRSRRVRERPVTGWSPWWWRPRPRPPRSQNA
jgi:hypothetical protein